MNLDVIAWVILLVSERISRLAFFELVCVDGLCVNALEVKETYLIHMRFEVTEEWCLLGCYTLWLM
jgi:hypothetical protein